MKLSLIQLMGRDINSYPETYGHIMALTEEVCKTETDLILLPECAFPGYFIGLISGEDWRDRALRLIDEIAALAGRYRKYIALGLARPRGGKLYNSLVVADREGKIVNVADKSNLWHFDSLWFEAGETFSVFDTEFGKIGCMVCADGRVPEIARILRLKGARMILDAANLVCSAPDPKELINQQYAFILRERARENGVYIALCDKCGVEDSSVTMAGRSLVVGPDGEIRAECSPDREEILNVEIDLNAVPEELRGCAADCSTLTCPTEDLSAFQEREHSYPLKSLECYTAVARFAYCGCDEYVGKSLKYIELCQKALCRFIVLPYAEGLDLTDALPAFAAAVRGDCAVAVGYTAGGAASAGIVYSGKVTQVPKGLSDRTLDLFDGVKLAVLFSGEMEAPEAPRVSMLQGADILLWMDGDEGSGHYRRTMQTRSAENRVFSVRSTPCRSAGYSLIVNPDGAVVCTTFKTAEHTAFGMIYAALSKCKTVISGTDIVQSRMPHAYGELLQYGRPSAEL